MSANPTVPTDQKLGNPLGLSALIIGAMPTLLGLVASGLTPSVIVAGGVGGMQAFAAGQVVVSVLLGLVAVVLGVIGLVQRGRPRAAAGAGTALGTAAVVSSIGSAVVTFAASALQSL